MLTSRGWRSATGPSSARNSATSRTRSANASARPAQPGSSASRSAYSFMLDPQPAALTTTVSTPAASKVSMVARANRAASSSRPLCTDNAPQQPWAGGTMTSQPSAASTRAVAALTPGKNSPWTQPVSSPTTARRAPTAGTRPGSRSRRVSRGARAARRRGAVPGRGGARDPLQQAAAADQPLQAGGLVGPQRPAQRPEPALVREEGEDRRPQRVVGGRAVVPTLDLRPGRLDQPVVLHAGGARGHACHAAEAGVEVLHHRVGHGLALEPGLHQVDAAARGVHLLAPQGVRRAGGQAEPAVHAVADQFGRRGPVFVE